MKLSNYYSIPFLTIFISFFQVSYGQKLTAGFSSGIVVSSIDDNDRLIGEKSNNTGLTVGGNFTMHLTEKLGLRTELNYERKGNTRTLESHDTQGTVTGRTITSGLLDYLTLPLLAEFAFGRKVKLIVNAGPSISYLLKYTKKDTYGISVTSTHHFDHTYAYKRFDFSLMGGLGFLLPLNRTWAVTGDARYFRGFITLPKAPLRAEQKNFGIIGRLGLRYVIKRGRVE